MSELNNQAKLSALKSYFTREALLASKMNFVHIGNLVEKLEVTRARGGRVFIAGNGGSAATAEHFAVDLGVGAHIRAKNRYIDAIALVSNTAILTAIGNDVDFEFVYSKQLEVNKPSKNDFVICISASGNSPNIIRLLETAKKLGVTSCAITGFDGGIAKSLSDISVHIETEVGEYGIVEDLHLSICHAITEVLRK